MFSAYGITKPIETILRDLPQHKLMQPWLLTRTLRAFEFVFVMSDACSNIHPIYMSHCLLRIEPARQLHEPCPCTHNQIRCIT